MFFIAKIPLPNLKPILSNDQDVPNAFEVQMDEYVELRVICVIYLHRRRKVESIGGAKV